MICQVFGCIKLKFGEIATIVRGASPRPICNFITKNKDGVNWIKIGDIEQGNKYVTSCKEKITKDGAKKSRYVKKGDFILSNSMSFGRPYILQIDGCIHDGWLAISEFDKFVISDYLYYLLNSSEIQRDMEQKASNGGAVSNLNADIVKNIDLTIPSLERQQEIVEILDSFDEYINSMTSGHKGEIEKNRERYEYYRDKLLTFERKVS